MDSSDQIVKGSILAISKAKEMAEKNGMNDGMNDIDVRWERPVEDNVSAEVHKMIINYNDKVKTAVISQKYLSDLPSGVYDPKFSEGNILEALNALKK